MSLQKHYLCPDKRQYSPSPECRHTIHSALIATTALSLPCLKTHNILSVLMADMALTLPWLQAQHYFCPERGHNIPSALIADTALILPWLQTWHSLCPDCRHSIITALIADSALSLYWLKTYIINTPIQHTYSFWRCCMYHNTCIVFDFIACNNQEQCCLRCPHVHVHSLITLRCVWQPSSHSVSSNTQM